MSSWLKPKNTTTRYSGMRTNAALFGLPIPVVFGQNRVSGKMIWYGDFKSKQLSALTGGSSILNKSGNNYVYYASLAALLAQGNCKALLNVWSGNGKFVISSTQETYVVPPGGGTYTVQNTESYAADAGAGYVSAYSMPVNDYGSPGASTLAGSQTVPLTPTTGIPGAGQYVVSNPTTGAYTFSASDAGLEVIVSYVFFSAYIIAEELYVIPLTPPYSITVEHQPDFSRFIDATFYPSGVGLTAIDTTPTEEGYYNANNGNYVFDAADAGKAVVISYVWLNTAESNSSDYHKFFDLTFISGATGQAPWPYLETTNPGQTLGYNQVAYVASGNLYLGSSPVFPNYNFELLGLYPFGAGIVDANPADCIEAIMSDPAFGVGFNSAYIDASLQGVARSYWSANDFFISPVLDGQEAAGNVIGKFLEASQVGTFWSEGLQKFVPYGDTTAVGNGATFTPPTNPIESHDDSDYIIDGNNPPIKHTRVPWQDAKNKVGVRWCVRTNDYNDDVIYAEDDASIDTTGLRQETPVDYSFICLEDAAQFAANLRVQRFSNVRNTYEYTLSSNHAYLEPMDITEETDEILGLSNTPVRIISVTDDPEKGIQIVAEDFPWSISTAVLYPKQGQLPSNSNQLAQQLPGDTDLLAFEAPSALGKQAGNVVYIFANGKNSNWGGCNLWISYNGVDYSFLPEGTISLAGRIGLLATELPVSSDPDVNDTLLVNMENSGANLLGVTQADADAFTTLSVLCAPFTTTPSYVQQLAGTGSGSGWTNPANLASTSLYADVSITGGGVSSTSVASPIALAQQFGFSFVVPQTVIGVQIDFEAELSQLPTDGGTASLVVQLLNASGAQIGGNKIIALKTAPGGSPTAAQFNNYTASGPLPQLTEWGTALTQANINSATFGVAVYGLLTNTANTIDIRVRNVRVTVYTEAGLAVELISYQNAELTGFNQYALSYLRRGVYGTPVIDWIAGSTFARLDEASYEYQYPKTYIGRTVYIKATSFNLFGNMQQSLADVDPLIIPLQGVPGAFDLGSGSVQTPAGATPPSWFGSMTYISTTTTITWIWNGILYRNDGTQQQLQGSLTITGLTPSTNYYFYPFIDDSNGVENAFVTFVPGFNGTGTPAVAQTAKSNLAGQVQTSGAHIPISQGSMTAATTSSGTGGGSQGGGGGGGNKGNID